MTTLVLKADTTELILMSAGQQLALGVPVQTAAGAGEVNTAANVGGGAGVFRDKVGVILNLRSLVGIGGIAAAVSGDTVEVDGSGVAGATWAKDVFVPGFKGQITYVLSQAPTDTDSIELAVNGVEYDLGVDYTVSGVTLTWLDPFVLKTSDKLIVQYR